MEIAIKSATLKERVKAFDYAEFGKASLLLATFIEQRAIRVAGVPQEVLEKESQLKIQLSFFEKQIATKVDNIDFSNITETKYLLDSLKSKLAEFKLSIEYSPY